MLTIRIVISALALALCASAQIGPRVAGTVKAGAGGLILGAGTAGIISKAEKPVSKAAKVETDADQTEANTLRAAAGSEQAGENSSAGSPENAKATPSQSRPMQAAEEQAPVAPKTPAPYSRGWNKRTWGNATWTAEPTRTRPSGPRNQPPPGAQRSSSFPRAPVNRAVEEEAASARRIGTIPAEPPVRPGGRGKSVHSNRYIDQNAVKAAAAPQAPPAAVSQQRQTAPTLSGELSELGLEIGMSIKAATEILGKPRIAMRGLFSRSHNEKYVFKSEGRDIVVYGRDGQLVAANAG